ncbi:hypothetical protein [Dyella terrae]|uniref:hypothetical protein n=1 Tax=Dyella terrae TaxID=522259 RepID=UPI001EFE7AB2|nr:hypothetical protein [Dyella terrae]
MSLQSLLRRGAVIPLESCCSVLIHATQTKAETALFGANVLDGNGQNVGVVAHEVQVFGLGPGGAR